MNLSPTTSSTAEATLTGTSAHGPVSQAERIQTIDILRGVALLGILMMNIPYFAKIGRAHV